MSSRYLPDVTELLVRLKAKSVYVFVVDGEQGTGGCPIVQLQPTHAEYLQANRELLQYMKRSVELYERDIARMEGR